MSKTSIQVYLAAICSFAFLPGIAQLADTGSSCHTTMPVRLTSSKPLNSGKPSPATPIVSHAGMVLIKGGVFLMGSAPNEGRPDEYPKHRVQLKDFWMDETEVTNAQFKKFVEATGYVTTAEKAPDWEELKKELPALTPKPADSLLVAASLVFTPAPFAVPLTDASRWWQWMGGANWKQPHGPNSTLAGLEQLPVVHISWDDANAYA
ncbi:MAG TPA: SUMF1/EgtB/PvdO family nonheme iron enzyme, partial [Flavisolibacter sp.]|nr:SUMF1/EgtB/PvdO family nonheme iron enzyme [Flavisolibacter sp.]